MHALHAEAERLARALLRGDGRRERRALFRSLEARLSRRAPGHGVAVAIRDRDRGVVERGADVRHTFGFDYSLSFFTSGHNLLSFRAQRGICFSRCAVMKADPSSLRSSG